MAVDPQTRQQTILSQDGEAGAGPAFHGLNSLTLVESTSSAYVTNQTAGNIMRVDLATGDREIVLEECLDESFNDVLAGDFDLHQIYYNEPAKELLIRDGDHLELTRSGSRQPTPTRGDA